MQRLLLLSLIVLALLLPVLAQLTGMEYYIGVLTRVLIFAIVASSLNFILGYGGMSVSAMRCFSASAPM